VSIADAFTFLFKNARDAAFVLDAQGRIVAVNRKAEKMAKIAHEQILGKSFRTIAPHGISPKADRSFRQILKGRKVRVDFILRNASRENVLVEATIMPYKQQGKVVAILGIVRDITEQKRIEEKMLQNEERYRSLVETLPEAIYTLSKDGTLRSLNPTFEKITGWSCAEWIGKPPTSLIHPDDLLRANEMCRRNAKGEATPPYELRVRTRSGEYIVAEFLGKPHIEDERITGVFGIVRDITERKKTEEALKSSETKHRALFENVPDGVYQSTPEGKILTANPALIDMLGYSTLEEFQALDIARDLYDNPEDRKKWMKRIDRRDLVRNAELVLRRKDGQKLIVLENSHAVRDKSGAAIYYEGTVTDITERKMLEKRLSALNLYGGKLNAAQNLQQIHELTLDALEKTLGFEDATFLTVSNGALQAASSRGNQQFLSILPLDGNKGITVKAAKTRKPVLVPNVGKSKDYIEGDPKTCSELAVPVITENRVVGVLDVQSSKLAAFSERELTLLEILASHAAIAISNLEKREENEKRSAQLALLMKNSAEMIHIMNLRQRLQKIAETIQELGWRRVVIRAIKNESMDLESVDDLVTAGLADEEREFLWNRRASGKVWRERFGPKFERFRIGEFYHLPWSDPWVRKKFSKGTVQSKLSQEDMIDWDPEDLLYAPLRLVDGRVVGILSIDDPLDGRRPTKESLAPFELFIRHAAVAIENAQLFLQLEDAKSQLDDYTRCLEERVKERTIDLSKSEEKLASIITASPHAITASDLNGVIIACNEQTLELHGYLSKDELIGKNSFDLIARKDHSKAIEGIKKTLEKGLIRNIEYTFVTKEGRKFPAELSASVVRDALGKPIGFVAITYDITKRKLMEKKLLRSERLAAIGEVAAMVGHDLRNPLTGIAGATYYLKMKSDSKNSKKKLEMLEIIEKDIEHANKIVNDLLDYSGEIYLELTETTARAITEETISMVKIPANVKVRNLTQGELMITVDVGRIKRVFLNMIKNAIDAMPKGGTLTIKSRKADNNVEFTFSDNGTGISKKVLEKLWTPLLTTKAKGMGLGLPICKRIAETHGGNITLKSVEGKGTTFIVTLPIEHKTDGGEKVWVNVPESLLSTMTKA
jgi:PAS domain S-box-containing protein